MLRSSRCVEDFLPISGRPENQLTFVRKKQTTFRNRNRSDVRGVLTMKRKIAYVEGPELIRECSRIPAVLGRAHRVSSLIRSTELILPKIIPSIHATDFQRVIPSVADLSAITSFHSSDYAAWLLMDSQDIDEGENAQVMETEHGLGYDCPFIENHSRLVRVLAGASLTAAECLKEGANIAINWHGGWHHAQRDSASGFCYVNDIVLAIQYLRNICHFDKVLYVDLDVHHGDGVENAFKFTDKVLTLSLHLFEPGFFPGTGACKDVGSGKGLFHSLNIPFKAGVTDSVYADIFTYTFREVIHLFEPNVIVVQCGADSLALDPNGGFSLTNIGYRDCVKEVLKCKVPTLFLGGGGYRATAAAKLWTYLTFYIIGAGQEEYMDDIPEDDDYFPEYGPAYDFKFDRGQRRDENTDEYLEQLREYIDDNLEGLEYTVGSI